jgi:hypothetical protein
VPVETVPVIVGMSVAACAYFGAQRATAAMDIRDMSPALAAFDPLTKRRNGGGSSSGAEELVQLPVFLATSWVATRFGKHPPVRAAHQSASTMPCMSAPVLFS